jgi:hypothetical protein
MSEKADPSVPPRPAVWRKVLAAVLDIVCVFAVGGYAIGWLSGDLSDGGFELKGGPAFILFGVIALYFVVFIRFLGGTPWQRLLGAR